MLEAPVALVMSQEGGAQLLSWMLGLATPVVPTVHLLGQPYTPHFSSTLSLYAANEVAPGIGYTPTLLSPPKSVWSLTGLADGVQATALVVSWTLTAAATVYGYYVSDDANTKSLWGELLPSPYVWSSTSPVFALQLAVQLNNVFGVS